MRHRHKLLAGALFVLLLSFVIFGAKFSGSFQKCADEYGQHASSAETGKFNQQVFGGNRLGLLIKCEGVFIDENSGTLLFIVTALLVSVAYQQFQTTRAQLRAYVFVSGKLYSEPSMEADGFCVWLRAKNTGQTPAYRVRQWVTIDAFSTQKPGPFKLPPKEIEFSEGNIGPGDEILIRAVYPDMTEQRLRSLPNQAETIYIWGEVIYFDAFGRKQSTKFRLRMPVSRDGKFHGLQIAPDGNDVS